jgi:hypothetical protein
MGRKLKPYLSSLRRSRRFGSTSGFRSSMCRCRLCGPQGKRVTARVFDAHTAYECANLLRPRPIPFTMYNAQTHSFRCFDSDSPGSDDGHGHGSVTDSDSERAWSADDSDDRGSDFSEQPMSGDDGDDDGGNVEPVGAAAQWADDHSDFRCKRLCALRTTAQTHSSRHYHYTR